MAGIVLSGYVGYVDRYLGRGFDLDSITAAVIGGTAFTGGRGSLLGTMAGVLLVQVLSSMLLVLGLEHRGAVDRQRHRRDCGRGRLFEFYGGSE